MKLERSIVLILGILLVMSPLVLAITGATPTVGQRTRWSGTAASSTATEGGNITAVNVAATELTDRWAQFSGNVSGTIILGDGSANVFSWTWASTSGGEVCVSTDSAFDFSTATNTTGALIDSAWSFGTVVDRAALTYTGTTCNFTFSQSSITNTSYADLTGSSTFNSCVVKETAGVAKDNLGFCTAIQTSGAGKNYANQDVNYELMVPTASGAGSEIYYFYAELS